MNNISRSPIMDFNHSCFSSVNNNNRFSNHLQIPQASYPCSWRGAAVVPYGLPAADGPHILYLMPVIFGASAAFIIGFGFFGHSLTSGYSKFIFFLNIYAIIAMLGAGAYIFELLKEGDGDARLFEIIPPLFLVVIFFALAFHTLYSLYPFTFSGTIGDTPVTQLISFMALSIGSISVGETFNINPEKSGAQFLLAIESFWDLFVLSLLISIIA